MKRGKVEYSERRSVQPLTPQPSAPADLQPLPEKRGEGEKYWVELGKLGRTSRRLHELAYPLKGIAAFADYVIAWDSQDAIT